MNLTMKRALKKISSSARVGNGTSETRGVSIKRFFEKNGTKYMIKGDRNLETLVEVFSYRLGKKLGLKVLPVFYIENGLSLKDAFRHTDILSVHKWEDNFQTAAESLGNIDRDEYIEKYGTEAFKMTVFDILIGNDDRHGNNFGVAKNCDEGDKRLMLIDHGLATPWSTAPSFYDTSLFFDEDTIDGYISRLIGSKNVKENINVEDMVDFLKLIVSEVNKDTLENILKDFDKYFIENEKYNRIITSILGRVYQLKEILMLLEKEEGAA